MVVTIFEKYFFDEKTFENYKCIEDCPEQNYVRYQNCNIDCCKRLGYCTTKHIKPISNKKIEMERRFKKYDNGFFNIYGNWINNKYTSINYNYNPTKKKS